MKIEFSLGNTPTEKNGLKEVETSTYNVEGDTIAQAVGRALGQLQTLTYGNSQYDTPVMVVNGVQLSASDVKKVKASFYDFKLNFPIVRESILAQLAFTDETAKEEFMRRTDKNGVFKNTKHFTELQVAAQGKEVVRLAKDLTKWAKEDAKDSAVPQEVTQRRELDQNIAKAKRIAIKEAAKQIAAAAANKAKAEAEATAEA